MLNRKASEYPQHLLSRPQTSSALLVSHGAMQITESLRRLSNEVCIIELAISAGGIGMGTTAYHRRGSHPVLSSGRPTIWASRRRIRVRSRFMAFCSGYPLRSRLPTAAIKRPEFRKPIKKILPSLKLKSSIASIS
jgi:hypothetical protein